MRIANPVAKIGEDLACEYLKKKGYKIIERNFRKKYQEIDIIAVYDATLVFIEVKTRKSSSYGSPFESIAIWKLKHLVGLSQYYKMLHPKLPDHLRIDAIGIILSQDNKIEKFEHLQNISGF